MTPEEMSIEEALARLKNGDLYDRKGDLTKAGYRALERLEGVDLNIRPEPVATSRIEQETEIERDITRLESRMARIEEIFVVLSKGVRIGTKALHGWGLNSDDEKFLTTAWVELCKELYEAPEENETPVATSKFENAIRDKLWEKEPEETNE